MAKQPIISKFFRRVASPTGTPKVSTPKVPTINEDIVQILDSDDESETSINTNKYVGELYPTKNNHTSEVPQNYIQNCDKVNGEVTNNSSMGNKNAMPIVPDFSKKLDKIMKRRYNIGRRIDENIEDENASNSDNESSKIKNKRSKLNGKLTPLDQQVKDLKLKHMDKVLVVRVGYKYKCFAQDAVIVSRILHIMLVPGKLTLDDSNPTDLKYKQFAYCSFPDIRLRVHLERLVHHSLKVAVIEQSETNAIKKSGNSGSSKGSVFERKITGIFSKATFGINSTFNSNQKVILGQNSSIWILSYHILKSKLAECHLISVNLNSGEIIHDKFNEALSSTEFLETRMKYLNPVEVLTSHDFPSKISKLFTEVSCSIISKPSKINLNEITYRKLQDIVKSLGKDEVFLDILSIIYTYLTEYNNANVLLISENYKPFATKTHMLLNSSTLESLDIFSNEGGKGSLFWLLDHTRTAFGSRQLREWLFRPLMEKTLINDRLDAIDCIVKEIDNIFFESLNYMLKNTPDLLRTVNRIAYGVTSRKEIYFFLKQMKQFEDHFESHSSYINSQIYSEEGRIKKTSNLLSNIFLDIIQLLESINVSNLLSMINVSAAMEKDDKKQVTDFFNLNNYDNSVNIIRIQSNINEIKNELLEELMNIRKLLKRPHLSYRDEVEYLIEVRNTQVKDLPEDWVIVNTTKMISRFHTPRTRKLIEKLQYNNDLLYKECNDEYIEFVKKINQEYPKLHKLIKNIGVYDCILSLAATSRNMNYVRPTFSDEKQFIKASNARNPIIESLDVNYVPNDILMSDCEGKFSIITGPNMGGKSSYIRQVALLVILAQLGSYVPADCMELGLFDNIFTRVGAYDNLLQDQSTFKVELLEVLHIIENCTENSLLLLDEVGRGTSTEDGKAISFSIINYFLSLPICPLVLFTTHYPSLGNITSSLLHNYHMDFVEQRKDGEDWPSVVFLYKLKGGLTNSSYGLNVARLANVDKNIINVAYGISEKLREGDIIGPAVKLLGDIKFITGSNHLSSEEKLDGLIALADGLI